MEKLVLLVLVMMALCSQGNCLTSFFGFLVDCGAANETLNELNITSWKIDEEFIKTGENYLLSMNKTPPQMNSLRFFPKGDRNCYRLPVYPYLTLFRAGFYYGNYDGLSKPPTFDLELNGNPWATVVTSLSEEPIFHEMFYTPERKKESDKLEICLVRRKDNGGVPFISSLEATTQYMSFDTDVNTTKTALLLHSRNRFGSSEQVGGLGRPDVDPMNRIWIPKSMPGYKILIPDYIDHGTAYRNTYGPPCPVIQFAIQANNISSSIFIPIDFPTKTPVTVFFVFYFSKVWGKVFVPGKRLIQVHIDGLEKGVANVSENYNDVSTISVYPVTVVGSANVTILAAENATLPAFINAMEVYTVTEFFNGGHEHRLNLFSVLLSVCFCFFLILKGEIAI